MVKKVLPDLKKILKGEDWIYVQDGATCHTSKLTQDFLAQKVPNVFPKRDWPANSPDGNAIENVFGRLENEVQPIRCPTIQALERAVSSAWSRLTPEYCRNCIEAIPKRLKKIIKTKGEYVVDK